MKTVETCHSNKPAQRTTANDHRMARTRSFDFSALGTPRTDVDSPKWRNWPKKVASESDCCIIVNTTATCKWHVRQAAATDTRRWKRLSNVIPRAPATEDESVARAQASLRGLHCCSASRLEPITPAIVCFYGYLMKLWYAEEKKSCLRSQMHIIYFGCRQCPLPWNCGLFTSFRCYRNVYVLCWRLHCQRPVRPGKHCCHSKVPTSVKEEKWYNI